MRPTIFSTAASASLVIVALLSFISMAAAQDPNSWGCENYWSGPSASNSIEDCLKNQDRNEQWTKWVVIPAIPALLLVIVLVFYPFVFSCRQCCNLCGGRRRQPGVCCSCDSQPPKPTTKEGMKNYNASKRILYNESDHRCVKCPAFVLCFLSIGVIITVVRGASEAEIANDFLVDDVKSGPIDTMSSISTQLQTALLNSSSTATTTYIDPVTSSTFEPMDDMISFFNDAYNEYVDTYQPYVVNAIRIGMNCLGAVPMVFLFLLPLYASRNDCRWFWPACTTCLYFLLAVVFSVLAILFLAMAVGLATGCGELERQMMRMPGIMQWYVKPYCEEEAFFDDLVNGFSSLEVQRAQEFCLALTNNCSASTTYSSLSPDDTFVCSVTTSNYASICTSYYAASMVLATATSKTGSPACASACTFEECQTNCTTSEQRTSAAYTMNLVTASGQFSQAYYIGMPLLYCDYLIKVGMTSVTRGCPSLRNSSWMIGFGCLFSAFLFAVGIIVLFRGQKVFYKLTPEHREQALQARFKLLAKHVEDQQQPQAAGREEAPSPTLSPQQAQHNSATSRTPFGSSSPLRHNLYADPAAASTTTNSAQNQVDGYWTGVGAASTTTTVSREPNQQDGMSVEMSGQPAGASAVAATAPASPLQPSPNSNNMLARSSYAANPTYTGVGHPLHMYATNYAVHGYPNTPPRYETPPAAVAPENVFGSRTGTPQPATNPPHNNNADDANVQQPAAVVGNHFSTPPSNVGLSRPQTPQPLTALLNTDEEPSRRELETNLYAQYDIPQYDPTSQV